MSAAPARVLVLSTAGGGERAPALGLDGVAADEVASEADLIARLAAHRFDAAIVIGGEDRASRDAAAVAAIAAARASAPAVPVVAVRIADREAAVAAGALDAIVDGDRAALARTIGIAARLARAEAHAAAVTAARDEVLAIVSHDLRSPLNAIALACEALGEDPTPEQRGRYVAAIKRATGRSDKLLRDLLEVSQIEGGGVALTRAPVEVAALVDELRREHEAAARERTIALGVELDPAATSVSADRERLRQVFGVLLANVVKFAPNGAATLSTRADGDWIEIAVRDRGPGFSAQALAGAAQTFWRPGQPRRSGVGVGLAIARGLIEVHGGTMTVENPADGGARVIVRLPRG